MNITQFYVTRVPYNDTKIQWQNESNHLMALNHFHNVSLGVLKLQSQVLAMVDAQTPAFNNENSGAIWLKQSLPLNLLNTIHVAGLLVIIILLNSSLFLFCIGCRAG